MRVRTYTGIIRGSLTIQNPPPHLCQELLRKLTFRNPKYEAALRYSPWGPPKNIPPEIRLAYYDHGNQTLTFPRGANYANILSEAAHRSFRRVKWRDERHSVPVTEKLRPLIELNQDQKRLLQRFKLAQKTRERPFGTYFTVSGTGTGKTVAQAAMAHHTGQKTLVLCQTNLIKQAWIDDLNKLYGLTPKEIGIIQQKRFKIGEHFTLAMIATLGRRRHIWEDIFAEFGTVILDEADIVKGDTVSSIVSNCYCQNIIGASATDDVKKGMGFMLPLLFGTPIERIEISNRNTATSMALTDVVEHRTNFQYTPASREEFDYGELLDTIVFDEERNDKIIEAAVTDWRKGHSVIVASKRLVHLDLLKDLAENAGVTSPALLTGETNTNKKYTQKLIRDILQRRQRFVIASVDAVKRGANINPVDRLHICAPVFDETTLEQLIGRIRRTYPDKHDCVVHMYVDSHDRFLFNKYKKHAIPVFQKLRVARYADRIIA